MKAIIFDIDGTLADASHRLHHVTGGRKDWDAFFAAMVDDACHEPIADLYVQLARDNAIVICTGRPETYREVTEAWLRRTAGVGRWAALYMRPAADHRPDHFVKAEMLAKMREDGFEPWLAIDDRPSIVAMWRENGITCLQCCDWDDRASRSGGLLTLMIGPSGAGKTTWLFDDGLPIGSTPRSLGISPSHVVSSDQIRADLCGDFRDQTRNEEVFAAIYAVVKARVSNGLPTVVDATNLRRKDRLAIVGLTGASAPVRYIVIDRPMEEKRRDAGWRAELGFDLIDKHDQIFRSQLKDILAGDGRSNVEVVDLRRTTA